MGWGTRFICEVDFNKQTFENEYVLTSKIEELEELSRIYKEQILMFCASNPRDITSPEWKEESIRFIHTNVSELLESLCENERELMKLYLADENFDTMLKV